MELLLSCQLFMDHASEKRYTPVIYLSPNILDTNIIGIAVGVSIAGFFLLIVIPIVICVIIWCCIAGAAAGGRRTHTTYVTQVPPAQSTATVVTTNQQTGSVKVFDICRAPADRKSGV